MFKNLSRDPTQKFNSSQKPLFADPWEEPISPVETKSIPSSWQTSVDIHPLLPPLEIPETRKLAPSLNPIKILLQDELKLNVAAAERLKTQMEKALGLLCWLENSLSKYPIT